MRELAENYFARRRRAGEDHLVRARGDGAAHGDGTFWKHRDKLRIKAGADDQFNEGAGCGGAAHAGFEQDGIASNERLDDLRTGQQQRVIAWADDEHNAERIALDFTAHSGQPERQFPTAEAAWSKNFLSFTFEEAAGFGEGKNFSQKRFNCRTITRRRRGFGQRRGVFSNEAAEFADQFHTPRHRSM